MRLIVTSQRDIAGKNIFNELAENSGFEVDGEFEGMPVFKRDNILLISAEKPQTLADHLDSFFEPEYYVFASRHRSKSGNKTLTVHVPGNLTGEARIGGRPKELAYCNASAMKVALKELQKAGGGLEYRVSLEATHHGPTQLKKPVLFVEVGSTEDEWNDSEAVKAVANAVLKAAQNGDKFETAVGMGGNHYAPHHTRMVLNSKIAIGHIIPSYAIEEIDDKMLAQAVERCSATFGFLDWKGMKKYQREKVLQLAENIDLKLKRGRDI